METTSKTMYSKMEISKKKINSISSLHGSLSIDKQIMLFSLTVTVVVCNDGNMVIC